MAELSTRALNRFLKEQRLRSAGLLAIPAEEFDVLGRRLKRELGIDLKGWDECPPTVVTPCPGDGIDGAWFDVDAVMKAVRAMCALRHTKGRWAGRPLKPDPWQIVWFLAPVFGWRYSLTDPDEELAGWRIVREAYIEIPRKNGKSTLSSAIALVLLAADGEQGGEVYAAAASKDQAKIVFAAAKAMANGSPELRRKTDRLNELIRHPKSESIMRVITSDGDINQGLNPHGSIIDELHAHKDREIVDALEGGTGARTQPMTVVITTADDGSDGTIYDEKHDRVRKLAGGVFRIPSVWGAIWTADPEADPYDERTMRAANPGFGRSVTRSYLLDRAARARTSPSYFPAYCRYHLNRRMRQQARWIRLEDYDQSGNLAPVDPAALVGRECYAGLDLSATSDFTACQLVFPDDDHERVQVLTKLWLPEDGLEERAKKDDIDYFAWARNGWIELTEGNVVDYDVILEYVLDAKKVFDLRSVRYDRWQAGALVNRFTAAGIEASPISQTYSGMSDPTKEMERLIKLERFQHGGHPVLRWMVDNTEILRDTKNPDNVRPIKPKRETTAKRIDGAVGSIMALDGWIRRPEQKRGASAPAAGGEGYDLFDDRSPLEI